MTSADRRVGDDLHVTVLVVAGLVVAAGLLVGVEGLFDVVEAAGCFEVVGAALLEDVDAIGFLEVVEAGFLDVVEAALVVDEEEGLCEVVVVRAVVVARAVVVVRASEVVATGRDVVMP